MLVLSTEEIETFWFELFYMLIEQMFFDAVDAEPGVGLPVDDIDVEI